MGTAERGTRSDTDEKVPRVAGRDMEIRGGDEDMIWVDEVGTGVG